MIENPNKVMNKSNSNKYVTNLKDRLKKIEILENQHKKFANFYSGKKK